MYTAGGWFVVLHKNISIQNRTKLMFFAMFICEIVSTSRKQADNENSVLCFSGSC